MKRRRRRFSADDLPLADAAVDALSDDIRTAVSRHWQRRAGAERRIGRSFVAMAPWLERIGGHPTVCALLRRAGEDEARHADICVCLAAHYAGKSLPDVDIGDVPLPSFGCDDERLEMALLIAGTCCVNETIATAYIEAALAASTAPVAIAANRMHLREEIDHARLGWAHLASPAVDDGLRAALGACLVRLLEANVPQWEKPDEYLPDEGVAGHGLPGTAATRATIAKALADLVIPGFARVGIDVTDARRWLAARA